MSNVYQTYGSNAESDSWRNRVERMNAPPAARAHRRRRRVMGTRMVWDRRQDFGQFRFGCGEGRHGWGTSSSATSIQGATLHRGLQKFMTNNPRQSRLAMHLSRRCLARTRRGTPCQSPAMPNGRCRMHGGKSPGAPRGNKNAFRHGGRSAEATAMRKETTELCRAARETIASLTGGQGRPIRARDRQ